MYQGDYLAASTVVFNFNTAAFADGSPITLAGSPALSVYKNSTTESTTGITLTVDYDSRTGMHHVVIDTSADGTFYAAGNDFDVIITTGTVGGTSVVGRKVGSFSLENRCQKADMRKANGTAITTTTAGVPVVDVGRVNNVATSPVTTIKPVIGLTTADTISALANNTITAASIASGAFTSAKFASGALDAVWDTVLSGHTTAGSAGAFIGNIDSNAASILDGLSNSSFSVSNVEGSMTGDVQGKVLGTGSGGGTITGTGVWALDGSGNAIAPASTALSNAVWTNAKAGFLTGDAFARLGAPAGASVSADVAGVPDALLGRNVLGGSSSGRLVKEALAALRNKVAIVGSTMTVYSTDDTTTLWTAAITTDNTAIPVTALDPA